MSNRQHVDVAIVGAGIAGIATAYYLSTLFGVKRIALIDRGQPMAFTSAQSGENYRNWWPHPTMTKFTDHSIDLMELLARQTGDGFNMTRRGYVLATRSPDIQPFLDDLDHGYGGSAGDLVRFHEGGKASGYEATVTGNWEAAPGGVDILAGADLAQQHFPYLGTGIRNIIHIRRAGDVDGYQLGTIMLKACRAAGVQVIEGEVSGITNGPPFILELAAAGDWAEISADRIVNAAGPFAGAVAAMMGCSLPVKNVFQQKIAFDDRAGAIDRAMPFVIDLDGACLGWEEEERALMQEDPDLAWLTEPIEGAIHCRPVGGENGTWIKLGWAFNDRPVTAEWEPETDPHFPEILLRGAANLHPGLKAYYGRFPRDFAHYGGYYTMTEENWPLIGPMGVEGAYMVAALSGFGTMAACAAGELVATWTAGGELPDYASDLSLARFENTSLMRGLNQADKGVL